MLKKESLYTLCYAGAIPSLIYLKYGLATALVAEMMWILIAIGIASIRFALSKNTDLQFLAVYINSSVALLAYYQMIDGNFITVAAMSWLLVTLIFVAICRGAKNKESKSS